MVEKIKKWTTSFIAMIVLEILVLSILLIIERQADIQLGLDIGENTEAFFTILSLSFVVSSLTTILSERSMPIYWSDVAYEMLIRPHFTNIVSLIAYVCATVVVSSIIVLIKPNYTIWCLGMTTILLIVLTSKMIMAYFSRERIKRKLKMDFSNNITLYKERLLESIIHYIDDNEINLTIECMDLLKEKSYDADVMMILRYAADTNPFIFYKLIRAIPNPPDNLLYETIEQLIYDGHDYGSVTLLLDDFIVRKCSSYYSYFISGISSVELCSDGHIETWQFQKAQNQASAFIEDYNSRISKDTNSIIGLFLCALIKMEYPLLMRMLETIKSTSSSLQKAASEEIAERYSNSTKSVLGILPYFQHKVQQINVLTMSNSYRNEIKYHLIQAINQHTISNSHLGKIIEGLLLQNDDDIMNILKAEGYSLL